MPASSFTIRETTGDQRTLELRGRALPYQGYELEGMMRAEFTRYPGNPVATVQVLGAEESPTTISGMWKDRFIRPVDYLGRDVTPDGIALWQGEQVADVNELCNAVDTLRLSGQLLEVSWDEKVRVGILKRFRQRWIRREDVEFEMEFEWASRGEAESPVTFPIVPSVEDFGQQARGLFDQLQDALVAPFEVISSFKAKMEAPVKQLEHATNAVLAASSNLASAISTPDETFARTLAAAETMKQAGSTIITAVETAPAANVMSASEALGLGDSLTCDTYTRTIKRTARQISVMAAEQGEQIRSQLRATDLLMTFVAREAMDLRDVAIRFYGSQADWRRLLIFNSLTTSKLTAGQLILVPKLQQAAQR